MILECGCDEAGRGSAIGEIYAGAVILAENHGIQGLADSKKLTVKRREFLAQEIKEKSIAWSIGTASLTEIEALNVHHASLLAMKRAIEALFPQPEKVYIDGCYTPPLTVTSILTEAVVKGDSKLASVSAASIIAKVSRDQVMLKYDLLYPEYGFGKHKGYVTKEHLAALQQYGPCPLHRMSYAPVRDCLKEYVFLGEKLF